MDHLILAICYFLLFYLCESFHIALQSKFISNSLYLCSLDCDSRGSMPSKQRISSTERRTSVAVKISSSDNEFMRLAIDAASLGVGNTFPNPAVGCVLVSSEEIIGTGFHPKAGYLHAEIFALLEACGYIPSGVNAANAVVHYTKDGTLDNEYLGQIDTLSRMYGSVNGAKKLFESKLIGKNVTAYVTLEPCCHYGRTPPCAESLVKAGVSRVVVGYQDPNPKVDGGGALLLENHGVKVDLLRLEASEEVECKYELENARLCAGMISSFLKRISPRTNSDGQDLMLYDKYMNGAKLSKLRSIAGKKKVEGSMVEFKWPGNDKGLHIDVNPDEVELNHAWMENVDNALWESELVVLRLNNVAHKTKELHVLGQRIASQLGAYVAQVLGHNVLLYRPGRPPVLDILSDNFERTE